MQKRSGMQFAGILACAFLLSGCSFKLAERIPDDEYQKIAAANTSNSSESLHSAADQPSETASVEWPDPDDGDNKSDFFAQSQNSESDALPSLSATASSDSSLQQEVSSSVSFADPDLSLSGSQSAVSESESQTSNSTAFPVWSSDDGQNSLLDESAFKEEKKTCWTTQALDLYRSPRMEGVPAAGLPAGACIEQTGISADGTILRFEASDNDVWYLEASKVTFTDPNEPKSQESSETQAPAVSQTSKRSSQSSSESSRSESRPVSRSSQSSSKSSAQSKSSSQRRSSSSRSSVSSKSSSKSSSSRTSSAVTPPRPSVQVVPSAEYDSLPGTKIVYKAKEPDRRTGKDYDALIDGQKFVTQSISATCVYTHVVGNAPRAVTGTRETADKVGTIQKGQKVTVTAVGDQGWCKLDWNGVSAYVPTNVLRR